VRELLSKEISDAPELVSPTEVTGRQSSSAAGGWFAKKMEEASTWCEWSCAHAWNSRPCRIEKEIT
jgi:hypothetical protein